MSTPKHTFGLTRRQAGTPQRQQPNGAKWASKNPVAVQVRPVEQLGGPTPKYREIVERKFTTYCRLSLGHPKHAVPKQVELLRQLFTLIQEADNTAAIQPYMPDDKVNNICHPSHILEKQSDFEHYFPEVQYYHDKIRTKIRLTSSISIKIIKNKIWGRIRQLNFWIDPTLIKSHETTRIGFLLYAHPDFTYRNDIVEIIKPIAVTKLENTTDFEFDAQPEKFTVVSGLEKLSEKVVMIRSTPRQSEDFQQIIIDLFAETNTTDIKSLRKYIFVPLSIVGDADKSTLQGLIRTQRNFRNNV